MDELCASLLGLSTHKHTHTHTALLGPCVLCGDDDVNEHPVYCSTVRHELCKEHVVALLEGLNNPADPSYRLNYFVADADADTSTFKCNMCHNEIARGEQVEGTQGILAEDEMRAALGPESMHLMDTFLARFGPGGTEGGGEGAVAPLVRAQPTTLCEAKHDMIEYTINLSCPACHMVFEDFEGCMALQCSSCEATFCGICMEQADDFDHAHELVRTCTLNPWPGHVYRGELWDLKAVWWHARFKSLAQNIRTGWYAREWTDELTEYIKTEFRHDRATTPVTNARNAELLAQNAQMVAIMFGELTARIDEEIAEARQNIYRSSASKDWYTDWYQKEYLDVPEAARPDRSEYRRNQLNIATQKLAIEQQLAEIQLMTIHRQELVDMVLIVNLVPMRLRETAWRQGDELRAKRGTYRAALKARLDAVTQEMQQKLAEENRLVRLEKKRVRDDEKRLALEEKARERGRVRDEKKRLNEEAAQEKRDKRARKGGE